MKSLNETVLSVVKESSGINEATHREIKKEIELKISKMSNDELKEFSKKHKDSTPQDVNRYMITNDVIDAEMKKRKIESIQESTSENPMHTEINTTALAIFDVLMSARFDKWYEGEFQSYVHGDSDDEDDISSDFEKQRNKIMNSIIKLFG